ncbi:hypothetical protein Tco_0084390 [Tanacetum coccineum]
MLAPKGPTFNGRPTFANPMYLKKSQSKKPCLYEIPYDKSDPANRIIPDREETPTLEKESQELVDQAWEKHSHDHFRAPTAHEMEILIKTCLMPLALKTPNDSFTFVNELKQELHDDLKYVESLEKEIDELEYEKAEFSNMYDILLQKCVSNDVMCSYLHLLSDLDAHTELQCSYLHKVKECECPYTPFTITIPVVPATDNTPAVPERTSEFGKFTSHDGESMESYYFRFYKMMNEMIRNNLIVATMQVNVQFLQQLQPEWSRFVTIVMQQHDLDTVSYHKLVDILKQYQKEVNEIRAERIAKNANPLALVAAAQPHPDPYYQAPKSHKPYAPTSKQSSSTRSNASTKFKGKEIAKPITPPSKSASDEDSDPEQAQKDKDMQKNLELVEKYFKKLYKPTNNNLRTSSNSRNKNVDTSSRYKNDHQTGQFGNQRTVTVAGARETVGSQLADIDEEIDEQELEAHYSFMAKIQEVPTANSGTDTEPLEQVQYDPEYNVLANDRHHSKQPESISNTCVVEKVDSNVIPDSPDMCDNNIHTDQNAIECDDKRVALANLIENLKLNVDENKKIQKQLKKANTLLAHELKECKSILAETSRTLGESNSIRDSCLIALQNKETELETYKTLNDRIVDYEKLEHKLNEALRLLAQKEIDIKEELVDQAWEKHSHDHFRAPTAHEMEILIKTCLMPLALKTPNDSFTFVNELKQEMHDDLKYVESLEKEIDEPEYEKAEFSNMYDILLQECVSNDVMCSYLHSLSDLDAHTELQCLYLHKVKECECLAQKLMKQTVSKEVYTELLRSFAKLEKHLISLELALQQCQEQMKNDTVCKEKASNVFLKECEQYFEIQDLKAQLQDKNIAICELKKLIEKCKGKSMETKSDKPSVVRQPNA